MFIKQVEISRLTLAPDGQSHQAVLCLVLAEPGGDDGNLTYLLCRTMADDKGSIAERLVQDALRQMRWMPEYQLGRLDLDRIPRPVVNAAA